MPIITELKLPSFDHTDPGLRGGDYRTAMAGLTGHDGWLASNPFGFTVLDRESGEFFLRTKDAVFPGLTIGELFGIDDGPLHEEIVRNIININGDDHRRLRNLVNPALAPRRVDRYRPAMRRFLEQLIETIPADGRCEFIDAFAKPYPSLVIAEVMGAPLTDAPRLHHWSNWIQRQFDAASLMSERELIEQAVAEFYEYADKLIEDRRRTPGEDLITDLITAEEQGDRLSHDELSNLVLNILVGGVDTSQSQLAHAVRLLAGHPDQWELLRADPQRARARGGRRGAPLRADHAVHGADHDQSGRASRGHVPGGHDRARVGLARQPRRRGARRVRHHRRATACAGAHVRRRDPLLRRREPRARRDAGRPGVPGRERAIDRTRRRVRSSSGRRRGSTGSRGCR